MPSFRGANETWCDTPFRLHFRGQVRLHLRGWWTRVGAHVHPSTLPGSTGKLSSSYNTTCNIVYIKPPCITHWEFSDYLVASPGNGDERYYKAINHFPHCHPFIILPLAPIFVCFRIKGLPFPYNVYTHCLNALSWCI